MTTTTTTTTTPTTSTTSGSSTAAAAGTAGSQQLAGNFNTFLQLLTTQLQNQDPLDPLDTNQFTEQLVEFASVQQQVDMNTNLQTLISLQQTSEATSAMQFLGATVTVTGNTAALASGSPATWTLSSPSPATGTVTITSSTGQVAYTGSVSLSTGTQSYSWSGQGNNGVTWPAGTYSIAVSATGANGQAVTVSSQVQGVVSGVNLSQNPPQLTVGGQSYAISAIQSISGSSVGSLGNLSTLSSSLSSSLSTLTNSINSLTQYL